MCKSQTPRFSAHLLHLALFGRFVSKKRENFAINENFSEYRRKKVLIAANHFYMLYRFRRELIEELQSRYEVIVAAPFQTGEEVFESMGIRCTETKMQRRRVQVLSELRLLQAYKRVLCLEKPDLVLTYAIKPNIYMGFLCTCYRIPFYATVQGLGSACWPVAQLRCHIPLQAFVSACTERTLESSAEFAADTPATRVQVVLHGARD